MYLKKDLLKSENNIDSIENIKQRIIAQYWNSKIENIKNNLINLDKDINKNTINLEDVFYCRICDKLFDNEKLMTTHIEGKQHKKQEKKVNNNTLEIKEVSEDELIEKLNLAFVKSLEFR